NILKAVAENPAIPISQLEMLTDADRLQLINQFNRNRQYDHGCSNETLVSLFARQARATPDNLAVEFNASKLTYQQLDVLSGHLAVALKRCSGVQKNGLIALKLKRNEWMAAAFLAVLKTGAAYVPIDPMFPHERIQYILNDCRCRVLIDDSFINEFKAQTDFGHVLTAL